MSDEELVNALCAIDNGLTGWEVDFIESIASQVEDGGECLTEAQRAKAEEILEQRE